jgi:hypothetical protein
LSTPKAQIFLDTKRTIAPISPLLFGGFAEHMAETIEEAKDWLVAQKID